METHSNFKVIVQVIPPMYMLFSHKSQVDRETMNDDQYEMPPWQIAADEVSWRHVTGEDDDQRLLLHRACQKKDIVNVGLLLSSQEKVDVTQKDNYRRTPLLIAIQQNCVAIAFQLLDYGGNELDAKDVFGKSALFYATENRNHTMVTHLLARNADPNTSDIRGKTPLMVACQDGNVCIVNLLLANQHLCLEQEDEVHSTALWYAAACGHDAIVKALLASGASVFRLNIENKTPLMIAAIHGHIDCVRSLVGRTTANINCKDRKGKTALQYACDNQVVDIFKFLVEEGDGDIKIQCERDGSTMLMQACDVGCRGIVEILLQQDKAPDLLDMTDHQSRNALFYACRYIDIFELLIKNGANHRHCAMGGKSLLMKAAEIGVLSIVECLLERMTLLELELMDYKGYRAVSYACFHGHCDVAKALIDAGANPFVVDFDDTTPLMFAASDGHDDIVEMLLSLGKEVGLNSRNYKGMTALSVASIRGYSKIVNALFAKGADPSIPDERGITPLMYACRFSHPDIVQSILLSSDLNQLDDYDNSSRNALYYACKYDARECVQLLLSKNANPCLVDSFGVTPLMLASRKGDTVLVKAFLQHMDGGGVNMQDTSGQTALFHACDVGHSTTAILLLNNGADPTKVCRQYLLSPLILACGKGHDVIVDEILKGVGQFYIDFVDSRLRTALIHASRGGHLACVKKLLEHRANVKNRTHLGKTALLEATEYGHLSIVKELVLSLPSIQERGDYMNIGDNQLVTPLHRACLLGYIEIAEFLVDHGASLTVVDDLGNTPLILSCLRREYAIVDMFLEKSTDFNINRTNEEGKSALFYAISNNKPHLIQSLARHGAKIGILFENGNIWRAGYPHHLPLGLLKLLVDTFGVDVNKRNLTGKPPLLLLTQACVNKKNAILFLLSRGANPWLHSPGGILPIMAARTMDVHDVLENAMMEDQRFLLLEKTRVLHDMKVHMEKVTMGSKTRESKRRMWMVMAPKVLKERLERQEKLPEISVKQSFTRTQVAGVVTEIVQHGMMNDDVLRELHEMMKTPWE